MRCVGKCSKCSGHQAKFDMGDTSQVANPPEGEPTPSWIEKESNRLSGPDPAFSNYSCFEAFLQKPCVGLGGHEQRVVQHVTRLASA